MAAVIDDQAEEPPASPTADELKISKEACSAGPGTHRSRVAVYFRLVLRLSLFDDSIFKITRFWLFSV